MSPEALLARIDPRACLDFLAHMVQHKSYTQTKGERELAGFMALGLDALLAPVPGGRVNAIGRWCGRRQKSSVQRPSRHQSGH
jgi:acetylornithine deacetylase